MDGYKKSHKHLPLVVLPDASADRYKYLLHKHRYLALLIDLVLYNRAGKEGAFEFFPI